MAKKSAAVSGPFPSRSEDDYRGEDDHRTLSRAAEIGDDPSRMKGVRKYQKKASRTLAKVGSMCKR